MKMFKFRLIFQWILFLKDQFDYKDSIGSDNGLAPSRRQAIIWINDGLIYWRIYASLSVNEMIYNGIPILGKTVFLFK